MNSQKQPAPRRKLTPYPPGFTPRPHQAMDSGFPSSTHQGVRLRTSSSQLLPVIKSHTIPSGPQPYSNEMEYDRDITNTSAPSNVTSSEADTSFFSNASSARGHYEYRKKALKYGEPDFRNSKNRPYQTPSDDDDSMASPQQKTTHVGPWILGKDIGAGVSGCIRLGVHEKDGRFAAIKIMSKAKAAEVLSVVNSISAKEDWSNALEREVIIMKTVQHPNIVSIKSVWESKHEL